MKRTLIAPSSGPEMSRSPRIKARMWLVSYAGPLSCQDQSP